jgi:hypothetical protein
MANRFITPILERLVESLKLFGIVFGTLIFIISIWFIINESIVLYSSIFPGLIFVIIVFITICGIWYYIEYKENSKYNPR